MLLLSACAASGPDRLSVEPAEPFADSRVSSPATDKVITARYPGTQTPIDEKSRRVATDLVSALHRVFQERQLGTEISLARPVNSFEYSLLEQLQLSGFQIFLAADDVTQALLVYSVELVSGGVGSANGAGNNAAVSAKPNDNSGSFNDYAFSLQFGDFSLLRQYRVSEQTVQPLGPMLLVNGSGTGNNQVLQNEDWLFSG